MYQCQLIDAINAAQGSSEGEDIDQTNHAAADAVDTAPADEAPAKHPAKTIKKAHKAAERVIRKKAKGGKLISPKAKKAPRAPKAPKESKADKGPNKKEVILGLLRSSEGTTIEKLMEATGWQKHSVHGQLANMRKKDGLAIVATKSKSDDGKSSVVYTIAA